MVWATAGEVARVIASRRIRGLMPGKTESRRKSGQAGERERIGNRVRLPRRLVLAHPQHPGKTHGNPRLVAAGALDALEAQLEDELGLHGAHGAEPVERVLADERVDL